MQTFRHLDVEYLFSQLSILFTPLVFAAICLIEKLSPISFSLVLGVMYRKKRPDPVVVAPDTASQVSDEQEPLFSPEQPHSSSYGAIN